MKYQQWSIPDLPAQAVDRLTGAGYPYLVSSVLASRGVTTPEEAAAFLERDRELLEQGVGCIELCGAFGPDGARRIIEATGNRIPVGYVTHLPEQEAVYRAAFPND